MKENPDVIVSEHTVSRRTEESAQRNGVVLQELIDGIRVRGYSSPNYVAIEVFGGRTVRTGNMGWITKELEKLGVTIHAVHSLPKATIPS
jgi:hypothetical protein